MCKPGGVPDHVDYRRYAAQQRTIKGTIPLVSLPRVVAQTCQAPEPAAVAHLELAFAEDSQRRVRATGRIAAQLVLQCQRCRRAFEQAIDTSIGGIVVSDDASAAEVPREAEPIMADGDMLAVPALAEDELLLALPMVVRCDNTDCRRRYETDAPAEQTGPPARSDNPFAVLKDLKRGGGND